MGKTRPPHPAEFRREALSLMCSGARTPNQLAADLGCTEQTLRNWLRQDEADRGGRADVLSSDERTRLRELERENRILRPEREILKRAASSCQGERSIVTRFRFIAEVAAQFPVSLLCRALGHPRWLLRLAIPTAERGRPGRGFDPRWHNDANRGFSHPQAAHQT